MLQTDSPSASPRIRPPIRAERDRGLLVLSRADQAPRRRVLFVNVSGGAAMWEKYCDGKLPSNRLWGCVELLRHGYEIGIADALPDFYLHRNPLPHDLRLLRAALAWLRPNDLVYCAHNTLYWLPLLKRAGLVRRRIVSLLYAREPLDHAAAHDGIIALTPAAEKQAHRLAPRAKVARLSWGMDLDFLPQVPFSPHWFLSCGRTHRDLATLRTASTLCAAPVRLIAHGEDAGGWPPSVQRIDAGAGWERTLPYRQLLAEHYGNAIASLITLDPDPDETTACGFTGLLEAMAMSRPVIMTRTNAVPREIDVEGIGCGIAVPPRNPAALARALRFLLTNPALAEKYGAIGRRCCESYYNMDRFGNDLHRFFEDIS